MKSTRVNNQQRKEKAASENVLPSIQKVVLDALLRDGEERLMLLSLLGRQCRQVGYAKAMAAAGAQTGEIASKLGIPPFAVRKNLDTARFYTQEQLSEMARLCLEGEYLVKSGQLSDAGTLEKVMLQILSIREGNRYV